MEMRGILWGREVSGQSDQRVICNTKIIRRAIGSRAIVNGGMCVGRELISITAFLAFGRIDELFAGMKATDMPIDKVCAGKPACAIGTTKRLFLSI